MKTLSQLKSYTYMFVNVYSVCVCVCKRIHISVFPPCLQPSFIALNQPLQSQTVQLWRFRLHHGGETTHTHARTYTQRTVAYLHHIKITPINCHQTFMCGCTCVCLCVFHLDGMYPEYAVWALMENPTIERGRRCICSVLRYHNNMNWINTHFFKCYIFSVIPGRCFLQLELSRSEQCSVETSSRVPWVNPFWLAVEDEAVFGDHAQDEALWCEEFLGKDVDGRWVRDPSAPNTVLSWLEICCSESANCCTFTGTERGNQEKQREQTSCLKIWMLYLISASITPFSSCVRIIVLNLWYIITHLKHLLPKFNNWA